MLIQTALLIAASGASAAFDPVSLFDGDTGFVFDLSDSSTVFQETSSPSTASGDSDPIGTLLDLSGNGNDVVAPGNDNRPIYSSSGYANFVNDANPDRLLLAFTFVQPVTFVLSFRPISVANAIIDGVTDLSALLFRSSGTDYSIFSGTDPIGAVSFPYDEDAVATLRFSGATSRIAKNNGAYTTGDAGSTDPAGVTFGRSGGGGIGSSSMRLYRAIGIGRDLTDDEITNARQWCAEAAGVTL